MCMTCLGSKRKWEKGRVQSVLLRFCGYLSVLQFSDRPMKVNKENTIASFQKVKIFTVVDSRASLEHVHVIQTYSGVSVYPGALVKI